MSLFVVLCFGLFCGGIALAQTQSGGARILFPSTDGPLDSKEKHITLEATLYLPSGGGKHPVLIFNHGLVSGFSRVKYDELADLMTARGIAVVMPMRRGLGGSEGTQNQPRSCDIAVNRAGIRDAIEDIDAAFAYVRSNPHFDPERILLGGNSRGGVLSLIYAATKKVEGLKGVINFVGTWNDDRSCRFDDTNATLFKEAGANLRIPTLWLYGEGDGFNSDQSVISYGEAFRIAGGDITFRLYAHDFWNGHKLLEKGSTYWLSDVIQFLDRLNLIGSR